MVLIVRKILKSLVLANINKSNIYWCLKINLRYLTMIKYVYILGVEGCGHHGFFPAVVNLIENSNPDRSIVYKRWKRLRNIFNEIWIDRNSASYDKGVAEIDRLMKKLLTKAQSENGVIYIIEDKSFPSSSIRDARKGWNLVELFQLMQQYAEVYLIMLNRDPIASTFSHMNWDGGFRGHAKVITNALDYLSESLQIIGTENFRSIAYEDLESNSEKITEALIKFIGLSYVNHSFVFQDFKTSIKNWRTSLNTEEKQWAMDLFYGDRSRKWQILSDDEHRLI